MNVQMIIQTLIGDVIFSLIIGAIFYFVSERSQREMKENLENEMKHLKEVLELHFNTLEKGVPKSGQSSQ